MNISNKVILITGSSKGIGKAIVKMLCKKGAIIYLNSYKSKKIGKEFEKELKSQGFKAKYLNGDISSEKDVKEIFEVIKKDQGKLDILINNAGIYLKSDLSNDCKYEAYENFHKVNGWGVYLCTTYAEKLMGKGKIVNISSIYGISPNPNSILASGIKSEVESYTKAFAKKFKGRIDVNAVAPGYTNTSLIKNNLSKKLIAELIEKNSHKRLIEPEEIAKAVVFLIENDAMTGQTLIVDCGALL